MYYPRLKKNLIFFILITSISYSCKKDNDSIKNLNENYVTEKQANSIAVSFVSDMLSNNVKKNLGKITQSALPKTKQVKSINPYLAKDGTNAFYIVNYKEGGFTIISADRRTQKILAFSESFAFNMETINPGLSEWLLSVKEEIETIREKNIEYNGQDKADIFSNKATKTGIGTKNIPIDTTCHDMYEEVLPMMQTT